MPVPTGICVGGGSKVSFEPWSSPGVQVQLGLSAPDTAVPIGPLIAGPCSTIEANKGGFVSVNICEQRAKIEC